MPIDVAMEQPGARVICNESQSGRMHRQHLDCVTADWVRLSLLQRRVEGWVIRSVVISTVDNLDLVTVNVAMG
jgi:hypothetical protein